MRIIGGVWRSRRLLRPDTPDTRPMPDRVKQAIFDMLGVRLGTPGLLPPIGVADLFSGGGSMGLEALSRGASRCWFWETGPEALRALRANVQTLAADERAEIRCENAWNARRRGADGPGFDLVFLDPPYKDALDTSPAGAGRRLLASWAEDPDDPKPLVVFHHPSEVVFSLSERESWRVVEHRVIGTNGITFFSA